MKKSKIKLKKLTILFITILLINNICFAAVPTEDIHISISDDFVTPGNKIIGILQTIGIVISVISLMIIGIKYMLCSVEGKAEYKKTLPYYLLGITLVGGIIPLVKLVYNIVQEFF